MTIHAKPIDKTTLADLSEIPHQPRTRDISFYIVLFAGVIPLWSVVPLSWIFVVYVLHWGHIWSFSWRGYALFAVALCEVFFSIYHYNLKKFVAGPCPNGPGNIMELQAAFRRVLLAGLAFLEESDDEEHGYRPGSPEENITTLDVNDPRAIDFRNYLRTWFGKVPWSSIRKQEMYSWLYWSIYNDRFCALDTIPECRRKILEEVLCLLEQRAGAKIPEGSSDSCKPHLLTLDPIQISWRPFFWYVCVAAGNQLIRRGFRSRWNAQIKVYNGLEYILRVPESWSPTSGPRPIVFLHGLGLGISQYKILVSHIMEAMPNHPVLVPLFPHVSQEIFHPRYLKPMGRHEAADCIAGLLRELGWVAPCEEDSEKEDAEESKTPSGVTLLSHSNGSFIHAWILKAYPEMATRSCFVDPVTFCSWEGDVCYNFIYRPATNGIELMMKYFVGMELGVANYLQRHFDWSSNSLWYEEIPNARDPSKTMFFLGGKDAIVSAERVRRYLSSHGVRKGLWYDPDGRHGQALLPGSPGHHAVIEWLQQDYPKKH